MKDNKTQNRNRSNLVVLGRGLAMAVILSFGLKATASPQATDSVVAQALNRELGGSLTADQIAAIENVEAEQLQQQEYQVQKVGFTVHGKNISLLVCVSGKAALVAKGRVGVCSTLGGEIYNLLGYGGGLSAGVQLSVFGVGVITPPGQAIDGTYGAATTVAQGGIGYVVKGMLDASAWRVQLHGLLRFLLAFGGPEFAVAYNQDSMFVMGGVGIGPMFDVGLEWFRLVQKS